MHRGISVQCRRQGGFKSNLSLLTLSHFFNIILQFLHQLLHNVTYTHTVPCTIPIHPYPIHPALYLYLHHTSKVIVVPYGYTLYYTLKVMSLLYARSYPTHSCTYTMLIRFYATLIYLYYTICTLYYTSKVILLLSTAYYTPLLIQCLQPLYYVLYMILLQYYYSARVILYMKVTLLACVYTSKACFYSCIVNFITITLYVPETLTILVFHTYKYTYFKYCKYSSTPCNSKQLS